MAALGVAVVGIIALQRGGADTPSTKTGNTASVAPARGKAAPDANTAGLNTAVRDGKFEFTVKTVQCGGDSVGTVGFEEKAQGQFCVVKMTVSNVGDEAQMLDGSSQYAFDADGKSSAAAPPRRSSLRTLTPSSMRSTLATPLMARSCTTCRRRPRLSTGSGTTRRSPRAWR
jgi:hypothetical protein